MAAKANFPFFGDSWATSGSVFEGPSFSLKGKSQDEGSLRLASLERYLNSYKWERVPIKVDGAIHEEEGPDYGGHINSIHQIGDVQFVSLGDDEQSSGVVAIDEGGGLRIGGEATGQEGEMEEAVGERGLEALADGIKRHRGLREEEPLLYVVSREHGHIPGG
uniref:Uncharacterized protein n=1 Tax=Nymphaea colorata TaxID=210225 RepID=A0A5K1BRA0_9MAGN